VQEDLRRLVTLQDIDLQIRDLRRQRKGLSGRCEVLVEKRTHTAQEPEVEHQKLKSIRLRRREREEEIEEIDLQLKKHEQEKYKVKSAQGVIALDHEIETLSGRKEQIEEQLLELMEQEEELSQGLPELRTRSSEQAAMLEEELAAAREQFDRLTAQLEELETQRTNTAQQLSAYHRKLYEHLRETKGGIAVVPVKDDACQGCFTTVSPSVASHIRHQEGITYCESCNRILYLPEET